MKKKLIFMLVVTMVLSMVSIPAFATPPENAEGVWCYLPRLDEFVFYKVVGGNQFFTFGEDANWTGTFAGDSYDYGSGVIHSSGAWFFKGIVSFTTVTVDGETGSLELRVNGSRPDAGSNWVGRWVITGGGLHQAGLRGQGTFDGPGWPPPAGGTVECPLGYGVIPYEGNIHFESD